VIKLVRKWGLPRGRHVIITLEGSFHGRTMAALAATGQPRKREPFEPIHDWFRYVPPGDVEALKGALEPGDAAAVFLEPVMGEGGVIPLDLGYLREVRALCDEHGALFAVDEVQAGTGRCGHWLSISSADVVPDVVALAKALGGACRWARSSRRPRCPSLPASTRRPSAAGRFPAPPPSRCSTRSSATGSSRTSPRWVSCSGRGRAAGSRRYARRGPRRGLLNGFQVAPGIAAHDVVDGDAPPRALASTAGPDTVRFTPPYTITAAEVDEAVKALSDALGEVAS